MRRTIRRSELRQIVPLADSTIYELERRGAWCGIRGEVLAWIESRRAAGRSGVKKAPAPDVRKRTCRPISSNG
ncbi:MAG: transcriptional regulator [Betaproteobacteria bacterium]|nr:transcriptional regulator [Betaproteobacteria bacterium]